MLALQLSALGAREFAARVARPLLVEIGSRWQSGTLCVAGEHLISSALLGLLRAALAHGGADGRGAPRVVFACLAGERHELGLLTAAVCAKNAGAVPIYLGPDLPAREIAFAAAQSGARAVVVAAPVLRAREVRAQLAELGAALEPGVRLWVGGPRPGSQLPAGTPLESLESLEREIELLELEAGAR
jgi:methanogenic corrinoid protein MtbC1